MTDEKILAKVRALLGQADEESGATDAERAAYAEKAAELMAKYAISEALLAPGRPAADDPVESRDFVTASPYVNQKGLLLHVIAEALNCTSIYFPRKNRARVYGHRSDLDRVEFLYTSLLVQATRQVLNEYPPDYIFEPSAGRVRSYRVSWLNGFVVRIRERMTAGRDEAVRESGTPGAALVLADRSRLAQRALRAEFPHVRKGGSTRSRDASGYYAGKAAGGRADLGHGQVGGNRRAIG